MDNLGLIISVLFFVAVIALYIYTIADAIKIEGSDRIVWLLVIIFTAPLGSIIYLIVNPRKNDR
jgi:hypothetical protein